jgi:cation diffusion facilitator family transporter
MSAKPEHDAPFYGEAREARGGRAAGKAATHGDTQEPERAIRAAIACSVFGAVTKLGTGFFTGSMAMISSGVDSLGDVIVSLANLFVIRYGAAPPDEEHNYGHAKIEGLGAMFEGGFIFAAGLFIVYQALRKAAAGEPSHDTTLGIGVMITVLAVTLTTVIFLRRIARETGSLVVKADSVHYLTDVWVNVGVLVSLVLVRVTGLPLVDTVISIAIAVFMVYSSLRVVRDGFDVVMDRSLERETVDGLIALLRANEEIESFHDFKTRRGKTPVVDFHIVVRPDMTTREVHDLYVSLRDGVRALVGPTTRVLVHADPTDDAEEP